MEDFLGGALTLEDRGVDEELGGGSRIWISVAICDGIRRKQQTSKFKQTSSYARARKNYYCWHHYLETPEILSAPV